MQGRPGYHSASGIGLRTVAGHRQQDGKKTMKKPISRAMAKLNIS